MDFNVPMWQQHHAAIFQTNEIRWSEVYRSWTLLFAREGWTDEEVCEAVLRMSGRPELPRFPPDHLQALRRELGGMVREMREASERVYSEVNCPRCGSTGWVLGLPCLEQVVGGLWSPRGNDTHKTVAVTCDCPRGRARNEGVRQHWSKDPLRNGMGVMGIVEYTKKNPSHSVQVTMREEFLAAERTTIKANAGAGSASADHVRAMRDKLAKGFQVQ